MENPIKQLERLQEELGFSDTHLAKRYLRLAPSTWGRLKNGTYGANPDNALRNVEAAIAILLDESDAIAREQNIVETADHRAAKRALKESAGDRYNRITVYLAPTGGGKTTLANLISRAYGRSAIMVEATESWRGSYLAACNTILAAAGQPSAHKSSRLAESALLDFFIDHPGVLVIDEAHYFGPETINLIKAIVNRAQASRVLMFAIPELWDRMNKASWQESAQVRRRTYSKITVSRISAEDIARYFRALPGWDNLGPDQKHAVERIRDAAHKFGLWDTVTRIAAELRTENTANAPLTPDHIDSAITRAQALNT